MSINKLTPEEINRYHRHLVLPEFGKKAQEKLKATKVLIVGLGGLGSPISTYLTAAGVGTIGIIDNDIVSESNLQRQVLYTQNDIGKPKVEIAKKRLQIQNPYININTYNDRLNAENALDIIKKYDLVADGTDNFTSRYFINDVCKKINKPYVYGSISEYSGQVSVFNYKNGPSYSDVFPKEATGNIEKQEEIGVLGVIPGIVGCIQSNEVIKIITGIGEVLSGKLLLIDTLNSSFSTFEILKRNSE